MTKDEQDALIFLSRTHRELHEDRIKRSFKIVVSTLTIFALCIAARFSAYTNLPVGNLTFTGVVWIMFLALGISAAVDIYCSKAANNINRDIAQEAENSLIADLQHKGLLGKGPPNNNPRKWNWLWEILIVLLGTVASAFVVTCIGKT